MRLTEPLLLGRAASSCMVTPARHKSKQCHFCVTARGAEKRDVLHTAHVHTLLQQEPTCSIQAGTAPAQQLPGAAHYVHTITAGLQAQEPTCGPLLLGFLQLPDLDVRLDGIRVQGIARHKPDLQVCLTAATCMHKQHAQQHAQQSCMEVGTGSQHDGITA